MRISKTLKKYLSKYKFHYFIGLLSIILVDIVQLQIPILTGNISDRLQANQMDQNTLMKEILFVLLIGLIIACLRFVWRHYILGTSRKIESELRDDFFEHLEKMSLQFFNEKKTGDLMAYATNDLSAIRMMLGMGILMALDVAVLTIIVIYKMVTSISLSLTLMAIIPLPVIAVGSLILGRSMRRRFKDKQEAFAQMSDFVQENISGIRVIKAFIQETKEIIAFNQINKQNFQKNMSVARLHAIMVPLAMVVSGLSIGIVLGYGGYLAIIGELSIGQLVAFLQYILMLVWPMIAFGWCINMISQGSASMSRYEELMGTPPDVFDDSEVLQQALSLEGNIDIKNLSFRYPKKERYELKNISLQLKQGETLGIVGKTGSGKTTLVNLLLRMYDPPRNTIFMDGIDILELPLEGLRNQFGYVPQDSFLFSDTIHNNISFGIQNSEPELVMEAAKQADVHHNIVEFPKKYETIIGERGVTLSGGQKQRLSIARALIKKPQVLIMDDALSAVDTQTEDEILAHLKEARKEKSNIIIAHRVSTLQDADKIIVLENGEIVETGNHESLMKAQGIYYKMAQRQQLEKEILEQE